MMVVFFALGMVFSALATNPPEAAKKHKPIMLDEKAFTEKIYDYKRDAQTWKYEGDKPAIVYFWASWCGPCRKIAPLLEELAAEYGDEIYIYKVNVDQAKELAEAFGIRSIPSLLFIPMEGTPQMAQGALPKETLKKAIDELLLKK